MLFQTTALGYVVLGDFRSSKRRPGLCKYLLAHAMTPNDVLADNTYTLLCFQHKTLKLQEGIYFTMLEMLKFKYFVLCFTHFLSLIRTLQTTDTLSKSFLRHYQTD